MSAFRRRAIFFSSAALFAIILIVAFWRPGILRGTPNDGHQLGGDLFSDLSGNTLECFERGIELHESDASWLYAECDIRETSDNCLVVFHDWDISSLPNSKNNQTVLGTSVKNQPICELSLAQIQQLELGCGCKIPTLEQVMQKAVERDIKKPILLEFKHLHSDAARERLFQTALRFREQHNLKVNFLSFVRNVPICFPDTKRWMNRFSNEDICVYQVYRPKTKDYDLCRSWD